MRFICIKGIVWKVDRLLSFIQFHNGIFLPSSASHPACSDGSSLVPLLVSCVRRDVVVDQGKASPWSPETPQIKLTFHISHPLARRLIPEPILWSGQSIYISYLRLPGLGSPPFPSLSLLSLDLVELGLGPYRRYFRSFKGRIHPCSLLGQFLKMDIRIWISLLKITKKQQQIYVYSDKCASKTGGASSAAGFRTEQGKFGSDWEVHHDPWLKMSRWERGPVPGGEDD